MSEWISVDDRLPDKEGKYIVYDKVLGVQLYYYHPLITRTTWDCVSHWMDLPEKPGKTRPWVRL